MKKLLPLVAALVAVTLSGCASQLPWASSYPMKRQYKMQSAQHWDVLAEDVAGKVRKALDDRVELRLLAIDVEPEQEGPFHDVFKELLQSQLVSRGIQVPEKRENQLKLKYKVQVVKHGSRFQRPPPGALTAIGAGVSVARDLTNAFLYGASGAGLLLDVGIGHLQSHSNHEIVITTQLVWRNRYVIHTSDIYYINDADNMQYGEAIEDVAATPEPTVPPVDPLESMGVESVGAVNE